MDNRLNIRMINSKLNDELAEAIRNEVVTDEFIEDQASQRDLTVEQMENIVNVYIEMLNE